MCCEPCVLRVALRRRQRELWLGKVTSRGAPPTNRVIGVGEFVVQLKVIVQSAFGRRDMLTSPCLGVLLVPPVHTTLFSVQNKQFFGHLVWDPQCLLRLRSLHVNAINPYVGYWTGASALQQLRQPVTMETRYILYPDNCQSHPVIRGDCPSRCPSCRSRLSVRPSIGPGGENVPTLWRLFIVFHPSRHPRSSFIIRLPRTFSLVVVRAPSVPWWTPEPSRVSSFVSIQTKKNRFFPPWISRAKPHEF